MSPRLRIMSIIATLVIFLCSPLTRVARRIEVLMSKRFPSLQSLQAWLNGPERGEYEIEYIVKDGSYYVVLIHPIRNAA